MDETRYDITQIRSKPLLSENAKSKEMYDDFLHLTYSLGWQCTFGTNICVLDEGIIAFGAGTSIVIMTLSSGGQTILPAICGTGIAHIILHPDCTKFAVAEKGQNGTIDIFQYPNLSLTKLLKGDNKSSYVCLDYNTSGYLLAALTSAPEFSITIWHWETESILLKTKAFSQEVNSVKFSKFFNSLLITSGVRHIKFWSISRTFTGLKLKGNLGKFGHTDISDIHSFVQLSDGKVVSSSNWGNLLVWDDNVIKIQITRVGGKPCHEGIIYQISLEESELYTVGSDGWIRVWDSESIEMIYSEEEHEICEIKPLGEIHVNPNADLRCIFLSPNKVDRKLWYAQDAKGAIWKIDISLDITSKPPEIVRTFPGVRVTGCEMCPVCHLLAISSKDCVLRIYNYLNNTLVMSSHYESPITSLLWGTKILDKQGGSLFLGFEDGVVRWIVIKDGRKGRKHEMLLHGAVKAHNDEITCMAFNVITTYLVSCSLDGKIFYYFMRGGEMKPIGFIDVHHAVEWVLWLDKINLILIGNRNCFIAAVEATKNIAARIGMTTFELHDLYWSNITLQNAISAKSITNLFLNEKKASETMNAKSTANDEYNATMEKSSFARSSHSETSKNEQNESETEAFDTKGKRITIEQADASGLCRKETGETIKENSFNVTSALYTGFSGKFWLCLENGSPGIIYEYILTKDMIFEKDINLYVHRQIQLPLPNPRPITCMKFMLRKDYLMVGQSNGVLTVYAVEKNERGMMFSEFFSHGILDSETGAITHLSFSFDGRFLAVVSGDNNILILSINAPKYGHKERVPKHVKLPSSQYLATTHDADGKGESLEDTCKAGVEIQLKKNFEKRRQHLTNQMKLLRANLAKLNEANFVIPSHMQVNLEAFAVHKKIREKLDEEMRTSVEQLRQKYEYDIKYNTVLREKLEKKYKESIATEFFTVSALLSEEKIHSYKIVNFPASRYMEVDYSDIERLEKLELEIQNREDIGKTLDMFDTVSLLNFIQSTFETSRLNDEEIQERLEEYIGDYKLKTSPQHHSPLYVPMDSKEKLSQLLRLNLQIYEMKRKFNIQLSEMQQKKDQLLNSMTDTNALTTMELNGVTISDDIRRKLVKAQMSLHSHVCNLELSVCPWQTNNRFYAAPVIMTDTAPEKTDMSSFFSLSYSWKISKRLFSLSHKGSFPTESKRIPSQTQNLKHASQLAGKLDTISKITKGYEEENLLNKVLNDLWAFDTELHFLKVYRYCLDFELKQAKLKCLIYLQELCALKKYDEEKNRILVQCNAKSQEKAEMEAKAEKQLDIITQQQNYLDSLYAEEEIINNTLPIILGENNANTKLLTKFFRKKVKWKQIGKHSSDENHPEDVNQERDEDEDESEWSSDDDDNDGLSKEWDSKNCPAGCDYELFQSVMKLRQNRSFVEYKIKEIKQLIESHKKVNDILEKKCKLIEESTMPLRNQFEGIQLMKQKELNKIQHIVYLRLDQIIHCIPPLPANLDKCVLFPSKEKDILNKRLDALAKQTSQSTQISKDVQAKEIELKRECHLLNKKVHKLKEIAKLRMIDKFGQIVDLEELKGVENPVWLAELKSKQKQQTQNHEKALKQRREKMAETQKVYMKVMKERAINVQTLTALKAEWLNLHTNLSKRKKFIFQVKHF